jgi:hypothetical protein
MDARTNNIVVLCSGRSGSEQMDPSKAEPHQNITTVVVCIAMSFYPYSDAFSGIRSRKLTIKMLLFLSIKKNITIYFRAWPAIIAIS